MLINMVYCLHILNLCKLALILRAVPLCIRIHRCSVSMGKFSTCKTPYNIRINIYITKINVLDSVFLLN